MTVQCNLQSLENLLRESASVKQVQDFIQQIIVPSAKQNAEQNIVNDELFLQTFNIFINYEGDVKIRKQLEKLLLSFETIYKTSVYSSYSEIWHNVSIGKLTTPQLGKLMIHLDQSPACREGLRHNLHLAMAYLASRLQGFLQYTPQERINFESHVLIKTMLQICRLFSTEFLPTLDGGTGVSSTKDEPGVSSTKVEPGVSYTKDEPGVSSTKDEPGVSSTKVEPGDSSSNTATGTITEQFLSCLLQVLDNSLVLYDDKILAATGLVYYMNSLDDATLATNVLATLIEKLGSWISCDIRCLLNPSHGGPLINSFENSPKESSNKNFQTNNRVAISTGQLALIGGILASGFEGILTENSKPVGIVTVGTHHIAYKAGTAQSAGSQNGTIFFKFLFKKLYSSANGEHQYVTFQLLAQWTRRATKLAQNYDHIRILFSNNSEILPQIFDLVLSNLDNPTDGVETIIDSIFAQSVESHVKTVLHDKRVPHIETNHKLSEELGKNKPILTTAVEMPHDVILTESDDIKCQNGNIDFKMEGTKDDLTSENSEVHPTAFSSMNSQNKPLLETTISRILALPVYSRGRYRLLAVIVKHTDLKKVLPSTEIKVLLDQMVLCMSDDYMVPKVTELFKALLNTMAKRNQYVEWHTLWFSRLTKALCSTDQSKQFSVITHWIPQAMKVFPRVLADLLGNLEDSLLGDTMSRDVVLLGLLTLLAESTSKGITVEYTREVLLEGLYSKSDDIRAKAFSLLCVTHKTTEAFTSEDLDLLRHCIPLNMSSDSPSFRNTFLFCLKHALVRIRDSSLRGLGDPSAQSQISNMEFIHWYIRTMAENLYPGFSYQRLKMALEGLQLFYDNFIQTLGNNQRKGLVPDGTKTLIEMANRDNADFWGMFSERTTNALWNCLQNGTNEIREISCQIFLKYFHWPIRLLGSSEKETARYILTRGLSLCQSVKPAECESGAILCKLVFMKYSLSLKWSIDFGLIGTNYNVAVNVKNLKDSSSCAVNFLSELQNFLRASIKLSEKNPYEAAIRSPSHGLLSALTQCLGSLPKDVTPYLAICQDLAADVSSLIDLMMMIMAGKCTRKSVAPSFEEMCLSIKEMIETNDNTSEDNIILDPKYQTCVSWCWQNLKEGALLLGKISGILVGYCGNNDGVSATVMNIGEVLLQILTQCRHWGAIMAANSAFIVHSTELIKSHKQLNTIPGKILQNTIASLESNSALSSITRRSAGFPLLVTSILLAELQCKRSELFKLTINALMGLIKQTIDGDVDELHDVPVVHGLNVMKAIVQDSRLVGIAQGHLGDVAVECISKFASPYWAIRNAAMQLYGGIEPRLLGQNKSKLVDRGNINITEFLNHFPSLSHHIKKYLIESGRNLRRLHPSLFPVISLVSNLGPCGTTSNSDIDSLVEPVTSLAYHSIYNVRVMAAKALPVVVPDPRQPIKLEQIIKSLPTERSECNSFNTIHGKLLQIQYLLKEITRRNIDSVVGRTCGEMLIRFIWLAGPTNPCSVVRALFWQILQTCKLQLNLKELNEMMQCSGTEIGSETMMVASSQLMIDQFVYGPKATEMVKESLLSSCQSTRLVMLTTLTHLMKQTTEIDWPSIQLTVLNMLLWEMNLKCRKALLDSVTAIHLKMGAMVAIPTPYVYLDNLEEWERSRPEAPLADIIYPVYAVIAVSMIQHQQITSDALKMISMKLYNASKPDQSELKRFNAALALRICGPQILKAAEKMVDCDEIKSTARLLLAGIHLLEDEISEVKHEATYFAHSLALTEGYEFASLQPSHGLIILCRRMLTSNSSWRESLIDDYIDNLPIKSLRQHIQATKQRKISLYESDKVNMFAEPVKTTSLLLDITNQQSDGLGKYDIMGKQQDIMGKQFGIMGQQGGSMGKQHTEFDLSCDMEWANARLKTLCDYLNEIQASIMDKDTEVFTNINIPLVYEALMCILSLTAIILHTTRDHDLKLQISATINRFSEVQQKYVPEEMIALLEEVKCLISSQT
ncbi:unnamed protein product [Owenia fusiformis]|uniref:DUF2428 domain-containing protein n=1 Tax=Owenia fusiformis TaxID=6347 RepID=A0A8S4PHQ9_OWEFU|nr:unnamed protein product [Owenia fusiformis]